MNPALLKALAGQYAGQIAATLSGGPRDFAAGWIEGRTRYMNAADKTRPLPSWFDARTTGRAASAAAVAFYQALDGLDG